jgi:hypothetical protein
VYFTVKDVIDMQIPWIKKLMHIKVKIFSKDIREVQECDRCHINLDIRSVKVM